MRRPYRRRHLTTSVPTLALAAWTTACYTTHPYQLPRGEAAGGAAGHPRVTVTTAPSTLVLLRCAAGDTMSVDVHQLSGTIAELRGDTVVLRAPRTGGLPIRFNPPPGHAPTDAVTATITAGNRAQFGAREFSALRTSALAFGLLAVLALVLAATWPDDGLVGSGPTI